MSRVSKEKSLRLTEKLLENNKKALKTLKEQTEKYCLITAFNALDEKLKKVLLDSNLKDFINKTTKARFMNGSDVVMFDCNNYLPSKRNFNGVCEVFLVKDKFESTKKMVENYEKKMLEYQKLHHNIYSAILALKTEKRILDEFPQLKDEFEKQKISVPSNLEQFKSQIL